MRLSASVYAGLVVAFLSFTPNAHASPITYEISGVASGKIGATTFTNAVVELTGIGNTANIVSVFGVAFAEPITTTVTIQGVGTATITDPTEIFSSDISLVLTTGFPSLPYVVIGRIDSPPDLNSFTGIGFGGNAALLGYDLSSSVGLITTTPGGIGFPELCGTAGHDPCLGTTLGALSFTSNFSPTSQGTFSATLQPVPEPTTLTLTGLGLASIVTRYRRRRARSES